MVLVCIPFICTNNPVFILLNVLETNSDFSSDSSTDEEVKKKAEKKAKKEEKEGDPNR